MHLTQFTDYSLRVLIYLGLHQDRMVSISEISEAYDISRNHLLKVVHHLSKAGVIDGVRGRGGGLQLARKPEDIKLGQVVRLTEPDLNLVECFSEADNTCPIASSCRLKRVLADGVKAFLNELDKYSIAELIRNQRQLTKLLA
jgi:Rrf2 family nitric oxide-sensitive transcriptional repressor